MARYSSSRRSRAAKLGAATLALVGALGFTAVWHDLHRLSDAVAHNIVPSVALVIGLIGFLYLTRDTWLGWFGWITPKRALRLVRAYLDNEHYSVRVIEGTPPKFNLEARDTSGRSFTIVWQETPYVGVSIAVGMLLGDNMKAVWATATWAQIRSLKIELMRLGLGLEGGLVHATGLKDPAELQIIYLSLLPRDMINYEEFFRRLLAIQGRLAVATELVGNLGDTLTEQARVKRP